MGYMQWNDFINFLSFLVTCATFVVTYMMYKDSKKK